MGRLYNFLKKIYYISLHFVTFGKGIPVTINGFRLKLPTKYYRHFPADYEKSSFDFFRKHMRRGVDTIDIGAHIGLYSVFFARLTGGKVYSFEPTSSTIEVLQETVRINKCDKQIIIVPAAVGEKPGKALFFTSKTEEISASNSLVDFDLGEAYQREGSYEVEVVSVDDFIHRNGIQAGFLKIDAEGVELEVLKGAMNTFIQQRPVAILGLHPFAYADKAGTLSSIWDLLREYRMNIQIKGKDISKHDFCYRNEFVYDVELLPE